MGFLITNWKLVVIAALVAAIAGMGLYVRYLSSSLELAESEKNVLKAELQVSQASVKSLQAAIDEQNSAVQKMKDAADAKEKLYLAEIARVKKNSDLLRQQAGDIMKRQPPQGVSKCDAANSLIAEEINRAKK
jgi:hypothetical protein